jgi:3-polyprenyl-4-hydroxybenzoate decarboxylase
MRPANLDDLITQTSSRILKILGVDSGMGYREEELE